MTQDEIIDIAVQAGMAKEIAEVNIDIVEAFAKLVAERALAQETALQALHNENERLGLYKDAYAEQEPVAWMYDDDYQRMLTSETFCKVWSLEVGSAKRGVTTVPLYTNPPQRTWVGLTDEEIKEFDTWHDNREEEVGWCNPSEIVAYIEAKLKEKNT
jgi:hypothetical protein